MWKQSGWHSYYSVWDKLINGQSDVYHVSEVKWRPFLLSLLTLWWQTKPVLNSARGRIDPELQHSPSQTAKLRGPGLAQQADPFSRPAFTFIRNFTNFLSPSL